MTENDWIARIQTGDLAAFEPLLKRYQPLLRTLAGRFFCPSNIITRAELEQAGNLGLMRAAKRFNIQAGVQFITYALPWALGEMRQALRYALDSTGAYARNRLISQKEAALLVRLERNPRLSELAEACGLEEYEILQALEARVMQSLDSCEAERTPLPDAAGSDEDSGIERMDLRMALEQLPNAEKQIVFLRYFRDKTQKELAAQLGKSQSQVSKLENRALNRLRETLS